MARKVMEELGEMMKDEVKQEEISDNLLQKAVQERNIKLIMNDQIYNYCRKNKIHLGEMSMEDLNKISDGYPEKYQQLLMKQVMQALRTNRGKPLSRIKEHHKSILLDQLD